VETIFKKERITQYKNFQMALIGEEELHGYGAGKDASFGQKAYKSSRDKILDNLEKLHKQYNFKIAFTMATLGGGCGTMSLGEISKDIRDYLGLRVTPICTIPFRREGDLLIGNAKRGLSHISFMGLNPLIFDNERMMMFSDSVKEGVEKANTIIARLLSSLVDLVEFGGFATPPIDIVDITRLIMPQCGMFSVAFSDNPKDFRKNWKDYIEFSKSVNSRPIEKTNAFVMFKAKAFPHNLTEEVISYLRTNYKTKEIIPTTMEDEKFAGFTALTMIWGLSISDIQPALKSKELFKEKVSFWKKLGGPKVRHMET
jgi:cell division GTPase FtsZ